MSMGFNTNDIFFNFTYKENQERYQSAEENYLAALKQVETDITRMQEDWELMVYQTKTREMNFIKAKRDLQAKKTPAGSGSNQSRTILMQKERLLKGIWSFSISWLACT